MTPKRVSISGKRQLKECEVTFFISLTLENTDDNGAYTQTRNTSTMFYCNDKNFRTVYKDVGKSYYNEKVSFNTYQKIYVSKEDVVTLLRRYCKAKSFPLKRIVATTSNLTDDPIIHYAAVLYQTDSAIKETTPVLYLGNSKKEPRHVKTCKEPHVKNLM